MHYKCGILSSPSACRLPLFFLLLRLEGPVASFETWLELGSQLSDHSGWCPASTWAVEGPCFLKSSVVIALKTRHKPACRVPKSQKNKSNPKQDGFVAGMLGSRTLAGHVADACPSSASFSWQLFAELYFTIYYFHHNPRWKKHVRGAWTPIALSLGAICGTSNLQYQKWSKRNQCHFTSLGLEEVQDSQDRSLWDTESFALEIKIKHVPQKGCPSSKAGKKLWQDCNLWNELFCSGQRTSIQHTKSELPQLALLFWLCDLSINLLVMASISKQAQIPFPYDVTFQSSVNPSGTSCPKYEPLALGLVCVEKTSARNAPSVQNLPLQCSQGTLLQPLVLVVPQAPAEILCSHLLRYS